MYKKALKLSDIVSNLRKKVEILKGKYDFLEYCNYEFGKNNNNIINKLQKILDKKKSLENLFFYMIRNFFPNIKLVENTFNTSNSKSTSTSIQKNNQMNDLRNNEIISQIYKMFNLSDNNLSNNNISGNNNIIGNNNKKNNIINNISNSNSLAKNNFLNNINNNINNINNINTINNDENINNNKTQIAQLMNKLIDKDQFNVEAREINTYNKIIDFQKKYFTDLDEQNNAKISSISFDNKDSQLIENNSINITNNDNIKLDKDLLTVTSNNNSLENNNNQFLSKKIGRDNDNSISDGSKDLL